METEIQKTEKVQETEKWRTIPEFPNYVISNQGRVVSKLTARVLKERRGRVSLDGNNDFSVSRIFHKVWFNEKAKHIKGFKGYTMTQDGTVLNSSGKKIAVTNGLVRMASTKGVRMAMNVENLRKQLWPAFSK